MENDLGLNINKMTKCLDISIGPYKVSISAVYLRSIVKELRTHRRNKYG
jgi:hypothetical protein